MYANEPFDGHKHAPAIVDPAEQARLLYSIPSLIPPYSPPYNNNAWQYIKPEENCL
jgi:hypothetical protein